MPARALVTTYDEATLMQSNFNLKPRHRDEALRAIRNHKYDTEAGGIVVPGMKLHIGGAFEVATNDGPWEVAPNLVTTEGLNYLIGAALAQATQKLAFYIAPFTGNVTVQATWTGTNFTATSTEFTAYSEATRVLWAKDAVSAGAVGNVTTPSVFTLSGAGTIRGVGLLEASAKSNTTGVLVAAARLSVDKVMAISEELRVRYTLSATST